MTYARWQPLLINGVVTGLIAGLWFWSNWRLGADDASRHVAVLACCFWFSGLSGMLIHPDSHGNLHFFMVASVAASTALWSRALFGHDGMKLILAAALLLVSSLIALWRQRRLEEGIVADDPFAPQWSTPEAARAALPTIAWSLLGECVFLSIMLQP